MDRTFNKLVLVFVALIIFDTLSLDITFKKQQFGVFSAIANTVNTVYSFVRAVK